MYWYVGMGAIYVALSIVFITDVVRNKRLSGGGKAGWILGLLFVPVASWGIYGYIRMRQNRGLA
jgi:Phospholipase_D-nuclease N-terminal